MVSQLRLRMFSTVVKLFVELVHLLRPATIRGGTAPFAFQYIRR